LLFLIVLSALAIMAGCGGNTSSGSPKPGGTPPTIVITADKTNIIAGQSATLVWSTTNATSVSIQPGSANLSASGNLSVSPTTTTTYTATATGAGGTATATVTISVAAAAQPPVINSLVASPTTVKRGDLVTLTWQTTNATSVRIDPSVPGEDNQQLPVSGNTTALPSNTTTYTLTATSSAGSVTATVTVTVTEPPPTLTFTLSPDSIISGQSTTLTWSSQNATSITIDNGVGSVAAPSGTKSVSPATTTTYTATATGPGGSITASATVTVQQQLAVTLTSDKEAVAPGETAKLSWTSQAATSVDIQPGIGTVNLSGSVDVTPQQTTTYTATAHDAAGNTKTAQVTVTVVAGGGLSSIKHIIFFVQENRSFDNYFGRLGVYRESKGLPNDIDGLPLDAVQYDNQSPNQPVHPYHQQTVCAENTSPSWNPSWFAYNNGAMDNFVHARDIPSTIDPWYHRAMAYYDERELPYYYELATQYATSDSFFSSVMSATIPNRMYLFAATSAGHVYPDPPPQGGFPMKTIFESLRDAKVSWRYYYLDNSVFLAQFAAWNDPAIRSNVRNISEYFTLLADPNADQLLPEVIFIERGSSTGLDEHPDEDVQKGAAKSAELINALLKSDAYKSSVFILTYDEFGGLYDHVKPMAGIPAPDDIQPLATIEPLRPGDFMHSGFRLPLIVVSPWVRPHYVSHTPRELTSILKLIEKRFGLSPLTPRDAWADDMLDFFDFSKPSLLTPPPLPVQQTSTPCDKSKEIAGQK
jgi:phospholipase C